MGDSGQKQKIAPTVIIPIKQANAETRIQLKTDPIIRTKVIPAPIPTPPVADKVPRNSDGEISEM